MGSNTAKQGRDNKAKTIGPTRQCFSFINSWCSAFILSNHQIATFVRVLEIWSCNGHFEIEMSRASFFIQKCTINIIFLSLCGSKGLFENRIKPAYINELSSKLKVFFAHLLKTPTESVIVFSRTPWSQHSRVIFSGHSPQEREPINSYSSKKPWHCLHLEKALYNFSLVNFAF